LGIIKKLLKTCSECFWYPKFPRLVQPFSGHSKKGINVLMRMPGAQKGGLSSLKLLESYVEGK